jgi:hypothetical protein
MRFFAKSCPPRFYTLLNCLKAPFLLDPLHGSGEDARNVMMFSESHVTRLLVIDQAPLLTDAVDECQRACRALERLRSELKQHETRDRPAYERWCALSFELQMAEARRAAALLREKEELLASLRKRHWERFFEASELEYLEAGENGGPSELFEDQEAEAISAGGFSFSDDPDAHGPEQEERRYDGDENEFMDDELASHYHEDDESVRSFEESFVRGYSRRSGAYSGQAWNRTSSSRPEGGKGADSHEENRRFFEDETKGGPGRVGEPPKIPKAFLNDESHRRRVKERYRLLVRKLHPDLNPDDLSSEEKSLWHQVQAAYQQSDLEQLDLLLAMSDAFSGRLSRAVGLHQLRRATREIERLLSPLRRKLEHARQERAWKFTELQDRSALQQVAEREFLKELARLKQEAGKVDLHIERFSRAARQSREREFAPDRQFMGSKCP